MLIVSKFRDYYDVGMNNGIDRAVVYEREITRIRGNFPNFYSYDNKNRMQGAVLAFCGKFYPFVWHSTFGSGKIDSVIWDEKEAIEKMASIEKPHFWDKYSLESKTGIKKFFQRKYPEMEELYHEYKTPIFLFTCDVSYYREDRTYSNLILNPNLKNIKFFKVKDPITAYQDIYMFISGVLGVPEKKPKPIDDKIMAASKGHDGLYSFRKPPGKRGKNRWR